MCFFFNDMAGASVKNDRIGDLRSWKAVFTGFIDSAFVKQLSGTVFDPDLVACSRRPIRKFGITTDAVITIVVAGHVGRVSVAGQRRMQAQEGYADNEEYRFHRSASILKGNGSKHVRAVSLMTKPVPGSCHSCCVKVILFDSKGEAGAVFHLQAFFLEFCWCRFTHCCQQDPLSRLHQSDGGNAVAVGFIAEGVFFFLGKPTKVALTDT